LAASQLKPKQPFNTQIPIPALWRSDAILLLNVKVLVCLSNLIITCLCEN